MTCLHFLSLLYVKCLHTVHLLSSVYCAIIDYKVLSSAGVHFQGQQTQVNSTQRELFLNHRFVDHRRLAIE